MKKTLFLTIIFMLLAIIFTSCIKTEGPDDTTDDITVSSETTFVVEKDAVIFSGGEFHYKIVRPEKNTQNEINQTMILHEKMLALSDAVLTLTTDEQYRGNEYSAETPEILIGYVSYPECQKLRLELAYNEYGFGVVGNKVVVTAWGDIALGNAIAAFCDYAQQNTINGQLVIPAGYREIGKSTAKILSPLTNVPVFKYGITEALTDMSDGFTQLTINETSEEMFAEYRATLSNEGYALYSENKMVNNHFVTYTKDNQNIYAYFIPYSQKTIIVASIGTLLPTTDTPTYTKVRDLSFTMFNTDVGGKGSGLGCLMQLEDGSFIIIDGGNNSSEEVFQIYNKLMELAPDTSNIIIRSWIITHAHGDHYGALVGFASAFGNNNKIKVESFIYNFCSNAEQTQYMSDGRSSQDKVRNLVSSTYPNAKVYKSLTGQIFHFAGTDMEILYTMSDFIPQIIGLERSDADLTKADGNIQSIVVRFITKTINSQTIMVTGDTTRVNIDEMCKRFGAYLKTDILMVPHHGWDQNRYRARGGTIEFYTYVDPNVVLWPDTKSDQRKKLVWNGMKGSDWENNYFLINSLNVKECLVAGEGTVTLMLPYYR